jgi:hypothetical protein
VISVVGPRHVVQVHRDVEQQLLVSIGIDHGAVAQRTLQPDAHRAVVVLTGRRLRTFAFGLAVDEDAHVDLVVVLIHDDLAHPSVVTAERDPKLKLTAIALPEPERVTELLRPSVRTRGPSRASLAEGVRFPSHGGIAGAIPFGPVPPGTIGWLRSIRRTCWPRAVHAIDCAPGAIPNHAHGACCYTSVLSWRRTGADDTETVTITHRVVLDAGEVEKLVLTQRNRMRAVVVSVERWSEMEEALAEAPDATDVDATGSDS